MNNRPKTYKTLGILKAIPDFDSRDVSLFAQKKVVTPDVSDAEGTGSQRVYSERNLKEFRIAGALKFLGLSTTKIGKVLQRLRVTNPSLVGAIQFDVEYAGASISIAVRIINGEAKPAVKQSVVDVDDEVVAFTPAPDPEVEAEYRDE